MCQTLLLLLELLLLLLLLSLHQLYAVILTLVILTEEMSCRCTSQLGGGLNVTTLPARNESRERCCCTVAQTKGVPWCILAASGRHGYVSYLRQRFVVCVYLGAWPKCL